MKENDKQTKHNEEIEAYLAALLEEYRELIEEYPDLNENIKKLVQLLVYKLHLEGEMDHKLKVDEEEHSKKRAKQLNESVSEEVLSMDDRARELVLNAKIARLALICYASLNHTIPKLVSKFMNIVVSLAHNHLELNTPTNLDMNSRMAKAILLKNLADFCAQSNQAMMLVRAQALYRATLNLYPELATKNGKLAVAGEKISSLEKFSIQQAQKELERISNTVKELDHNNDRHHIHDQDFADFQHLLDSISSKSDPHP